MNCESGGGCAFGEAKGVSRYTYFRSWVCDMSSKQQTTVMEAKDLYCKS